MSDDDQEDLSVDVDINSDEDIDPNVNLDLGEDSDDLDLDAMENTSQAAKLESSYYSVVSQITSDGRIIVSNRIEIYPDKELPELANPGTKAYEALHLVSNLQCFVLICGRTLLPRVSAIGSYKNAKSDSMLKLVSAGIVDWPLENRQRFALVFEMPKGKKILKAETGEMTIISDDKVISMIVEPALILLEDLRNLDLIHGAIGLDNIFLAGSPGNEFFILGECLSSAPSFFLNPIYETVTRAMARPSGRGIGTTQDDLYALGICIAMIARKKNLILGKSEVEIIAGKMELGSYGAIIGKEKLPAGIGEFLRGVLQDDIEMRWSLEDCFKWLEKRRIAPKQGAKVFKAARPFVFKEKKYTELRSLADAFSKNIEDAAATADSNDFLMWLRRNFEDKELNSRFEQMRERERTNSHEKFVCTTCMALDPFGPVRYKGLSLFPMGFGSALSDSIHMHENLQIYVDIISQQIFSLWMTQIFDNVPDGSAILSMLEKSRLAVNQRMIGYGMERVLYIANREIACMSPFFEKYYVLIPGTLLQALEAMSDSDNKPDMVLDRHMVAFLSVRDGNLIDPYLGYLNSGDKGRQIIGTLRVLAGIQRRFSLGPMPGICKWIVSLLGPAIENFNDRDLRQDMLRVASRAQNNGDLIDIINLVDDGRVVGEDIKRFANARREYILLVREKVTIEAYLKFKRSFGRASGRQASMIVSTFVAVIIIALYSFVHFFSSF